MTLRIVHQGPRHFNVEYVSGGVVLGVLEADHVGDQLPFESGVASHFWIGNVWVDPASRRRGIGAALVEAAKKEGVRRFGAEHVYARAVAHDGVDLDGVLAFHRSVGLTEIARMDDGTRLTRGVLR